MKRAQPKNNAINRSTRPFVSEYVVGIMLCAKTRSLTCSGSGLLCQPLMARLAYITKLWQCYLLWISPACFHKSGGDCQESRIISPQLHGPCVSVADRRLRARHLCAIFGNPSPLTIHIPLCLTHSLSLLFSHSLCFAMRSFVLCRLAALAAAVSSPLSSQEHTVETIVPLAKEAAPIITVVDLNRTYAIKLECTACPFGISRSPAVVEWRHPPPDSSLVSARPVATHKQGMLTTT